MQLHYLKKAKYCFNSFHLARKRNFAKPDRSASRQYSDIGHKHEKETCTIPQLLEILMFSSSRHSNGFLLCARHRVLKYRCTVPPLSVDGVNISIVGNILKSWILIIVCVLIPFLMIVKLK